MKIYLFTISVFLFVFSLKAQQYSLKFQVVDSSQNPIEFADVYLFSGDTLKIHDFTDEKGFFNTQLISGNYILQIQQEGVNILKNQPITLEHDIDLEIIKAIAPPEKELKGVIIEGKKKLIERKVDRMVFNVENSIATSSGSALDALKKTPKIKIEGNNIKIIGKSMTKVMIDDRIIELSGESLHNYLQSISSDQIKSIEIITNPPAKYEAEGSGGLINIVLKKVKKYSWNLSLQDSFKQSHHSFSSQGIDFNYNKNKLSLSTNVFNNFLFYDFTSKSQYYYSDGLWYNTYNGTDKNRMPSGRINLDYELNKRITLGGKYSYSQSRSIGKRSTLAELEGNSNYNKIYTPTISKDHHHIHTANFHVIYKLDTLKRKLTVDMNYLNYNDRSNSLFHSIYNLDNQEINQTVFTTDNGKQKIENYSALVDMEHPFSWIKFNYGGKLSFNQTDNQLIYYTFDTENHLVFDPTNSNRFTYHENTESLYFSATKEINERWKAQLGIRTEFTQIKGNSKTLHQTNSENYEKVFPTAYLSYNINDHSSLSLNYGKRIQRPKFTALNPFKQYVTPYSYITGNPDLKPFYTHNIEVNYEYQYLSLSLSYSKVKDEYTDITLLNNTDKTQISTKINALNSNILSLDVSYLFSKIRWWESNNEINTQYSEYKSDTPIINKIRNIGWLFYCSTDNSFYLDNGKNFIFNIKWDYSSKGIDELSRVNSYNSLDVAFKMLFLHKNLQVTLAGEDIFQTNRPKYTDFINNIKQTYKWYGDTKHFFSISVVYKLGNNNLKLKNRKYGDEDEKSRI